ncbi:MAG TPA: hypothetical protein VHT05_10160 [Candidatus Elarobacter sp.]|nr:hypothetical protein [Candidatus Elarobacter sp.]
MKTRTFVVSASLVAAIVTLTATTLHATAAVAATPKPMAGGANQLAGVSGGLGSTLFNGRMRIRKMQLRASTAAEATAPAGGSALTFTYIISNGTHEKQGGNCTASIVDADGISVNGRSVSVYSAYYSIQPGEAARGTIVFVLADPSFKPVKILLTDGSSHPAFRINLKPSDLPSAPAQ